MGSRPRRPAPRWVPRHGSPCRPDVQACSYWSKGSASEEDNGRSRTKLLRRAGHPSGGSRPSPHATMRICLVYDCLFPHTVGGAERWYRNLAETLAGEGHEVSYLTLRQWPRGQDAGVARVDVHVVGPRMALYTASGRRRILPPLVFGLGVLWHLLRHGRRYDVVHTCAFPYFSVLAAWAARRRGGYGLV